MKVTRKVSATIELDDDEVRCMVAVMIQAQTAILISRHNGKINRDYADTLVRFTDELRDQLDSDD